MYPIPAGEILFEMKKCRHCSADFPITDSDMELYAKVSPIFHGKKYQIPAPTLCPDCRQQRRLAHHNERTLYKGTCDATGKEIISIYSPDTAFTVYQQDYWWSDSWNPLDYGRDFDFRKGFFEQWNKLSQIVPKQSLINQENENSLYLNFTYKVKNCYLIFASSENQNCYFGNRVNNSINCVDCLLVKNSENCYECISATRCYNCAYSERITDSSFIEFCRDCSNCSDCFMCMNLIGKKFYIENKSYLEKDYKEKIAEIKSHPQNEQEDMFSRFKLSQIHRSSHVLQSVTIYGENIHHAKNGKYIFDGDDIENVSYSYFIDHIKDSMDINYGNINNILQYESLGTGANAHNILFSINVWPDVYNLIYCDTSTGCSYCFGCIGLRNRSYCILNKQYSKEEYEVLVPRIIEKMITDGEWGEFFPASFSPFGYNETVANEYFPLEKEQAKKQDFNWSDYEAPFPKVEKIIPASKLPDDIKKIPDDILNWAVECEVSKKPFRITRQELEFYRKHNLPIPRRHPDVRHMDRMKKRNPRKLFERKCDSCEKMMMTTYARERPETVYCEECYERVVIN